MPYHLAAIALIFIINQDLNIALELHLAGIRQQMLIATLLLILSVLLGYR